MPYTPNAPYPTRRDDETITENCTSPSTRYLLHHRQAFNDTARLFRRVAIAEAALLFAAASVPITADG